MPDRLIRILMPPKNGASDEQLYWWRVTTSSALIATILLSLMHMAWMIGALPFFEGEGFVRQTEFKSLVEDTRKARENTVQVSILDAFGKSCKARGEYRAQLTKQVSALRVEWKKLTGDDFPLPRCEDMG